MPRNNLRLMSDTLLAQLKEKFVITYDETDDSITVGLSNIKRKTKHPATEGFAINSKQPKRKVCFNIETIDIWKALLKLDKNINIFDVQNAIVKLRVRYFDVTPDAVMNEIKHGFKGIRRV